MDNIRSYLCWDKNYAAINREERNLAAIFYHALLLKDNLSRFLEMISCPFVVKDQEMGIYFEYAFIRDLWFQINGNDTRRDLILTLLRPRNEHQLRSLSALEFNKFFGAVPQPSAKYIQSPGNWSLTRYHRTIADDEEFLKVCKFKWSFNAKPDIVIHTSRQQAVCIEAKLESAEGVYPQKLTEVTIFKDRGLSPVGQTRLQEYLMQTLLGINTQFVFLVNKVNQDSPTHKIVLWKEVFDVLDTTSIPSFMHEVIDGL